MTKILTLGGVGLNANYTINESTGQVVVDNTADTIEINQDTGEMYLKRPDGTKVSFGTGIGSNISVSKIKTLTFDELNTLLGGAPAPSLAINIPESRPADAYPIGLVALVNNALVHGSVANLSFNANLSANAYGAFVTSENNINEKAFLLAAGSIASQKELTFVGGFEKNAGIGSLRLNLTGMQDGAPVNLQAGFTAGNISFFVIWQSFGSSAFFGALS